MMFGRHRHAQPLDPGTATHVLQWLPAFLLDPYVDSVLAADDDEETFSELAGCSVVCRGIAETMTRVGVEAAPDEVAEFFDWDGDILSLDGAW